MEQRRVERLNRTVSVVGLGTWQLGADWGNVDADAARAVLEEARERGISFFDTADVYGDGRSERFCAELAGHGRELLVATKMGRRVEQIAENYTLDSFLAWNGRSRSNLAVEQIDLVQLH
jgi:aryl-alcohol dehydrogenase-like predicted oxidoreductase